jgi:transposase
LGPRPDGLQVHHCNGIKEDNRACNLKYVTASENSVHRSKVLGKGRGEKHYKSKLSDPEIDLIRTMYAQGISQPKIAAQFNVRQSWVSAVVNKQTRCPLGEEARFPGREKLTVQQVREIKTKAAHGTTQLILAAEYKVSPSEVGRIVRGERWANVHL